MILIDDEKYRELMGEFFKQVPKPKPSVSYNSLIDMMILEEDQRRVTIDGFLPIMSYDIDQIVDTMLHCWLTESNLHFMRMS